MSAPTPPPQSPQQPVLVPVKLDAFIFNKAVCDGAIPVGKDTATVSLDAVGAKIAPIEQPNYTFLRLNSDLIQPDILNPIELHNSWPAEFNSRYTDLGTEKPYHGRVGIYLHWTLPRLFRTGVAAAGKDATTSESFEKARTYRGLPPRSSSEPPVEDHAPPSFPSVPNRWLVIRHIPNKQTIKPVELQSTTPEFTGWVVESDRLWDLKDLGLEVDLQTDVSPFIAAGDGSNDKNTVSRQAEVFIGNKTPLEAWKELYKKQKPNDKDKDGKEAKFLPDFTLLSSSNQLFPDYQPHNSNVFSMCDNMLDTNSNLLTEVIAHYYVIGWNAEAEHDLFKSPLLGSKLEAPSRRDRLKALKLKIKLEASSDGKQKLDGDKDKAFEIWLDNKDTTRTICHGAMYEVHWTADRKPANVPADTFCTHLNTTQPLSVGTTPLDALTSFVRAHTCVAPPEKPEDKDKTTIPKLEKWITALERHLLARDDGVETQHQASDLLYNWNYARIDGGQFWNASGMDTAADKDAPGGTPKELIKTLGSLNAEQIFMDAVQRAQTRTQQDLFSLWWKCVTDETLDHKNDPKYEKLSKELVQKYKALQQQKEDCQKKMKKPLEKAGSSVKPGALPAFYQQRDPTLLVGGIKSGWQHDYLEDLLVRIDEQIVTQDEIPVWQEFENTFSRFLPPELQTSIKKLVKEFQALAPEQPKQPDFTARPTLSAPLFHDLFSDDNIRPPNTTKDDPKLTWRDRWNNSQPWFPLFLEWEIEYYHIPFENWKLSESESRSSLLPQMRYNIPGATNITGGDNPDKHLIEGRVLLLPQPSFSLAAKIEQLFAGTPKPMLDHRDEKGQYDYLSEEDRKALQKGLHQLAFLSAPLATLTTHLTTMFQGNHIKPNLRNAVSGDIEPLVEAYRPKAGFDFDQLKLIDIHTDSTPFGLSMKPPDGKNSLFKPVTHGQFRFTKINIIDKFGQTIHAIDPTTAELPQPVWPCISEWYAPQLMKDGKSPNVVAPRDIQKMILNADDGIPPPECPTTPPEPCEFVQVPPMINQSARLNATFVVRVGSENEEKTAAHAWDEGLPYFWRPANDWENPIWGWVLINYANQGIQIFTQDGTFYREVRFGGPNGTQDSPAWLPFRPPNEAALAAAPALGGPEMKQLEKFVARLGNIDFMRAFWEIVRQARDNMLPAPEAYAAFTNSALTGRPLALAHAGWSLELADDQLTTQASESEDMIPRRLLPKKKEKDGDKEGDDDSDDENKDPSRYAFNVKIGDTSRGFDGLVGMFNCSKHLEPKTATDLGVKLDVLYTDYKLTEPGNEVAPTRFLVLRPFYPAPAQSSDAGDFARDRNTHLSVRAVLIDPFSPIHAYSGILPVRELSLVPWAWQGALSKMKAFFHAGPLVLTKDVPAKFNPKRELVAEKPLAGPPPVKHEEGSVLIPGGVGRGDWAWLQPYYPEQKHSKKDQDQELDEKALERFMVLPVAAEDERARFEEGPYTMVEGYLMKVGSTNGNSGSN